METPVDREIIITNTDNTTKFKVKADETVKLIHPEGVRHAGLFRISGNLYTDQVRPGLIILADIPYSGHLMVIDVKKHGRDNTYIKNGDDDDSSFRVKHPEIPLYFSVCDPNEIYTVHPLPFLVSWNFLRDKEKQVVTIELTPLPKEHALLMRYSIQ